MLSLIEKRKKEHVELCLRKDVEYAHVSAGFGDVEINAKGEKAKLALKDIDTNTSLLGHPLDYPFEIEAMTGGYSGAAAINKKLAAAAQEHNIIFCLGSQRAMIEEPRLAYTYKVRDVAPDILLFGNIGYAQLSSVSAGKIEDALKEVDADALYVHINPLQEKLQHEGDDGGNEQRMVSEIARVRKELPFPVAVKETGAGIGGGLALKLKKAGIKIINVAGAGGTAWGKIELMRGGKGDYERGVIPTVDCILGARKVGGITLVASGGIRSGNDAAKAIALGADFAGAALPFLRAKSPSSLIGKWADELKGAMAKCGSRSIPELKKAGAIIKGRAAERLAGK